MRVTIGLILFVVGCVGLVVCLSLRGYAVNKRPHGWREMTRRQLAQTPGTRERLFWWTFSLSFVAMFAFLFGIFLWFGR